MPGIIDLNAILANFSHSALMHFIFNMLVLWQISPLIEVKFRGISYAGIILAITSLITLGVARFSEYPTLGFSGIGLGMMVFAGFLYWRNKHISKQLLGWAAANIVLGLAPGISFAGHFIGALAGALIFGLVYLVVPKNK
jgi:membrane associated rhomboid family serine protease